MGLHIFWPASACLALFVVGVIMILIKYGPSICGRGQDRMLRYQRKQYDEEDENSQAYAREISESVA